MKPPAPTRVTTRLWPALTILLLVAAGCAKVTEPGGSSPTGRTKTVQALKLDVLSAVGRHLTYCDPDEFPVAHGTPLENARARLPMIRADRPAFVAILAHEGFSGTARFTPDQLITINRDYKQMQAIDLTPAGEGYTFGVLVPQSGSDVGTWRLSGTMNRSGSVTIARRQVARLPICPICLVAGVRIATPEGQIPVQDIRIGMRVWTTDRHGGIISSVALETGHMEAPLGHEVVRLTLANGRTVVASPGHPTADGRVVGDLDPGDEYEGTIVARVALLPYAGETWDLLPSGPTGNYFANGILLGSTLARSVTAFAAGSAARSDRQRLGSHRIPEAR
jgi:hypothetical protein